MKKFIKFILNFLKPTSNIELQKIRDNAPYGTTHYMKYGNEVLYMMKLTYWYRYVYMNKHKDWHSCKPSLFLKLFKIRKLP